MPRLSKLVAQFSSSLIKEDGSRVRGFLKDPPDVRATFDGLFTPRSMLLAPPEEKIKAGDVVIDRHGTQFLCGSWFDSNYRTLLVCKQFVLFEAPVRLAWSRPTFTYEPLTKQRRSGPDMDLGMITAMKESLSRVTDGVDVTETRYRVIVGQPIQLEDNLDKKRVTRVEQTLGLYYGETF